MMLEDLFIFLVVLGLVMGTEDVASPGVVELVEQLDEGESVIIGNVNRSYAFPGDAWYSPGEGSFFQDVRGEDICEAARLLDGEHGLDVSEEQDCWRVTDNRGDWVTDVEVYDGRAQGLRLEKIPVNEAPEDLNLTSALDIVSPGGPEFYSVRYAETYSGLDGNSSEHRAREVAGELECWLGHSDNFALGYVPSQLKQKRSE